MTHRSIARFWVMPLCCGLVLLVALRGYGQMKSLTPHGTPAAATQSASAPYVRPNLVYGVVGKTTLRLDAAVPDGPGPFPMVILVHGGSWQVGGRADMETLFPGLHQAHLVAFSIDYRLAPAYRWPACYDDLKTALHWVKAHAADFKGDPRHVALIGYSAGGQLVTMLGTTGTGENAVQAVVGMAPVTDFMLDANRRGGLSPSTQVLLNQPQALSRLSRKKLRDISAVNFVRPGLPPFFLLHGTADRSVPYDESVEFIAALNNQHVPAELITLTGATHRLDTWDRVDPHYEQQMTSWLSAQLRPSSPTTQRSPVAGQSAL